MSNSQFNLENIPKEKLILLDVRPILEGGTDPFMEIMGKVRSLNEGEVLHIINTFEPVPLYNVLAGKGFDHYSISENGIWNIYFFKTDRAKVSGDLEGKNSQNPAQPEEKVIELDVREMEPPEPMVKILETLPQMEENTVLLVHHHREPVMLYPKLEEKGFTAHSHQVEENYFKIVITKG